MLKVCHLVMAGKLSEHVLADSIEAVAKTKQRKPWAYFWSCLERAAGPQWRKLLASVTVPKEVIKPPSLKQVLREVACE